MAAKKVAKFSKKLTVILVCGSTILWLGGFYLFSPYFTKAQDYPPGMGHWPLMMIDGDAGVATSTTLFVFAGDDNAIPGTNLTVNAYYSNDGSTWSTAVACSPLYTDSNLFKCKLTNAVAAGSDGRSFYYYLEAIDNVNQKFYLPGPDEASSKQYPFVVVVYNTPNWQNTFSGADGTKEWTGVKDGRCFPITSAVSAGQTSISLDDVSAFSVNEWIMIDDVFPNQERRQITAIDATNNTLTISALDNDHPAGTCVFKFIQEAYVWVEGLDKSATTTADGTFILSGVPDGCYDTVAFKKGYCEARHFGLCVSAADGTPDTFDLDFFLPYGDCMKGGEVEGAFVIWTAPFDGMMGAPRDIDIDAFPILIALSDNASSTTVNIQNVKFYKEAMGEKLGLNPNKIKAQPSGFIFL